MGKSPNTKCKFSECNKGTDSKSIELNNGNQHGPKWSYTCLYCRRTNRWETIACCQEHYELYQQEVLNARAKNKKIDEKPILNDMSPIEYDELMQTPIEEVVEKTKEELDGYLGDGKSFADAVAEVNIENTISSNMNKKKK